MSLHRWRPGDALLAGRLNEPRHAARRGTVRGDGLSLSARPGLRPAISDPDAEPIVGLLSGSSSPYSFTSQVETDSSGTWADGPLTGTAYEVNGVAGLGSTRHRLYPTKFGGWRFQSIKHGSGGPPPVVVSCTGGSVPQTLTLSYTHCHYNTPPPDTSDSQSVSLVYDTGAGAWLAVQTDDVFPGAVIPNTCTRFEWRLSCGLSGGSYKWSLAYTVKNAAGSFTCQATATDLEDSASAGPLILTFTHPYSFYHGTCLGGAVTATVTE